MLRTLQIGLASLITFANFTPTIALGPVPTSPEEILPELEVYELTISEMIELESIKRGLDANLAKAIAFCESSNRQFEKETEIPLRGLKNPDDVGLFQINEKFHSQKSRDLGYDIYTLEGNTGYALWLLENEGVKHWKASQLCWKKEIAKV